MEQRTNEAAPARRHPWIAPRVADLPPLTQLTLQTTGIPGDCDPGDPGSCF
jgi:hypothetical protein